jgi:hypothetical protein
MLIRIIEIHCTSNPSVISPPARMVEAMRIGTHSSYQIEDMFVSLATSSYKTPRRFVMCRF